MGRTEVEEVKSRHPVEEVVGRYVELRRRGRRYVGLCPFHRDTDPSLVVFPEDGRWWCFGACAAGGDVLDFVMKAEGVSFREALSILGEGRLPEGRRPPPPLPPAPPEPSISFGEAHLVLLTVAAEVYRAALQHSPQALSYLAERGVERAVAEEFRVGYGVALGEYLRFRGWDPLLAREVGLLDDRGREWFRGRLVIPEFRAGRAVYLAGRQVPGVTTWGPKYLFLRLPKPLYGQERVRASPDVFVVEGPVDYLLLWGWGYPAVALLGNRLLPRHAEALKGKQVYLVPDRDDGGRALWREARRLFGPGMKTVILPEGVKDVGELVQRRSNARAVFGRLVDEAR